MRRIRLSDWAAGRERAAPRADPCRVRADVLVVAPFNEQVRCLAEALPPGARIGTVDCLFGRSPTPKQPLLRRPSAEAATQRQPPQRPLSAALLAQAQRARHDLAEEHEVALGVWMRSLVDEDLTADELVAVERLVEDEVTRVTDQHPTVLGAEHLGQALEGELVNVQPLRVA